MGNSVPALLGGSKVFEQPLNPFISIGSSEISAATKVLESGTLSEFIGGPGEYFMGGSEVQALEAEWAKYFGTKHALSLNSATSGLHSAVVAAGIGPGDEVIVPSQTMSATATAVIMAGAIPVFVDQKEQDCCLNPKRVEAAMTDRTRGIIAVNLFGAPADVLELKSIADRHGAVLIEDNAQGPLGRKSGKLLGTIGHMGVFSLNYHKVMQCGEGGVVVTDDDNFAERIALIRNHGENVIEAENLFRHEDIVGYNYRLTEVQAAIARVQLTRLRELTARRLNLADALTDQLSHNDVIRTANPDPDDHHVYYLYPMWFDATRAGMSREVFVEAMSAEGCPIYGGYCQPLYHLPLIKKLELEHRAKVAEVSGVCPVAERAYRETLMFTTLPQTEGGLELVDGFSAALDKTLRNAEILSKWSNENNRSRA